MKNTMSFGLNKTPTQIHPHMTDSMEEGYEEFPPVLEDPEFDADSVRAQYIQDSEPFGSVPVPTNFTGVVKSGVRLLKGNSPAVLIDKLGERLAFERGGVRLYDALITKVQAAAPEISLTTLNRFREDEIAHYFLVKECITSIGGDPTAQTPCADASGVASMGLVQLMTDPRSTVQQCVEGQLIAEMTDVAGWELLIELTHAAGLDEFVEKFEHAKITEDIHTETMRTWLTDMTMEDEVVEPPVLPPLAQKRA